MLDKLSEPFGWEEARWSEEDRGIVWGTHVVLLWCHLSVCDASRIDSIGFIWPEQNLPLQNEWVRVQIYVDLNLSDIWLGNRLCLYGLSIINVYINIQNSLKIWQLTDLISEGGVGEEETLAMVSYLWGSNMFSVD